MSAFSPTRLSLSCARPGLQVPAPPPPPMSPIGKVRFQGPSVCCGCMAVQLGANSRSCSSYMTAEQVACMHLHVLWLRGCPAWAGQASFYWLLSLARAACLWGCESIMPHVFGTPVKPASLRCFLSLLTSSELTAAGIDTLALHPTV